ncbi:MAG TPA: GNAT family N-acetyltransferase [Bacteroidales bacterium]|nr:GNAT family N-acetyltransferase [Bacteroidales bacterium]
MNTSELKDTSIHITEMAPLQSEKWNAICNVCSNFFQTTYYDEVNAGFKNKPVYFQVFKNEVLVAGIKIYTYQSGKPFLKSISRQAHAFGEPVINCNIENNDEVLGLLAIEVLKYLNTEGYNYFKSKPVYGGYNLIFDSAINKKKPISFACLSLSNNLDTLWDAIYKTHRRYILKAQKNGLEFAVEDNFDDFYRLLIETYAGQSIKPPDRRYLYDLYSTALKYNAAEICFVKDKGEYLSAIMVIKFGKRVEYMHGGMHRNMLGSGHMIHWHMMMRYKAMGFETAGFGQVADADPDNMKMGTVSDFKLKFGCSIEPSWQNEVVLHATRYKIYSGFNNIRNIWKK